MRYEGGCACEAVRYAIDGEPTASGTCHCRSCRKAASAPSLPFLTVAASAFAILSGAPATYRSSPRVTRWFCANCGSPLAYANAAVPGEIDVMTCSLDDPAAFPPRFSVWLDHAPAWLRHDDGLPTFATTRQG